MIELQTVTEILDGFRPPIASPTEYRRVFLLHLERNGRTEKPQSVPLKAGIDCGRWMSNCECGGAIALHPQWQFAACLTCGRSWNSIEFPTPEFMQHLDEVLSLRPTVKGRKEPSFYSWWPPETLEDLYKDNLEHGWPIPQRMP